MPVYLRKNVSYTPPSLDKLPHESEDDYVNDPELLRDSLPQPYRMIDKTLRSLIDDTWEVIAEREEHRFAEARKVRPPQYNSSVQLDTVIPGTQNPEKQRLCNATCICNSPDGSFVFVGLPCGLVAIEALTQQIVGTWEEDGAEISYMKAYSLAPQTYMITSIDDMGIGRLFAFTYNKICLLKVLNQSSQESDNKTLISKIEASTNGDYLGAVMENPTSHDLWLEVFKLPRDTWVTDLESIVAAIKKREEKERKDEMTSEVDTESVVAPSETAPSKADTEDAGAVSVTNSTAPLDSVDQQSQRVERRTRVAFADRSTGQKSGSNKSVRFNTFARSVLHTLKTENKKSRPVSGKSQHGSETGKLDLDLNMLDQQPRDPLSGDYKFGAPQLIMKVKVPAALTGVNVTSLQTSCQKVDSGDVVGAGHNIVFTQNHLDLRKSVFDHLHDNLLKYLPDEEESGDKIQQYPNFHFLTAGRMLPQGLEQPSLEGRPTTIAVWWPGTTNLLQYSLIKSSKDLEFKPDLIWPFSCKITCTEVSPDTNVIAVGLDNGSVVVWDKYMGTQRGVVNVQDGSPVVQIKLVDPALYPQDSLEYPPYNKNVGAYILVMCANSALFSVSTGTNVPLQVNAISLQVDNDNDTITVLQPFTGFPDLLLTVTRCGSVQIRDTLQGTIVCQVQLPESHELSSPWEPILAIGGQGQNMYIKGNVKSTDEESEIDSDASLQTGLLFVYQLRSFPSLDKYWKTQRTSLPFTVHTKVEQRVDALLADRLAMQEMRKNRMQDRWAMLKDEINNIHTIRDIARINADKRKIVNYEYIAFPHYQLPLP